MKKYPLSDQCVESIAAKVLLTPDVTRMWVDHLHTVLVNRKTGAKKAAETRRANKITKSHAQSTDTRVTATYCGQCAKQFEEETEESELWMACNMCEKWYCGTCERLESPPSVDIYIYV